ncbi:hypothetical protein GGS20DRAFT_591552 [Poronia punctata]|nr:hypothetical protein GGS20DRAFT_591552 [Poronia punctata]
MHSPMQLTTQKFWLKSQGSTLVELLPVEPITGLGKPSTGMLSVGPMIGSRISSRLSVVDSASVLNNPSFIAGIDSAFTDIPAITRQPNVVSGIHYLADGASIIPTIRGSVLRDAYSRRTSAIDMNMALEPQNFYKVQADRRKAFGESS